MSLLLDTHVLLWAAGASERLPAVARAMIIEDPGEESIFSAASIWEVVIENGLGRADFSVDPHLLRRGLLENGYTELAVTGVHVLGVGLLPPPQGSLRPSPGCAGPDRRAHAVDGGRSRGPLSGAGPCSDQGRPWHRKPSGPVIRIVTAAEREARPGTTRGGGARLHRRRATPGGIARPPTGTTCRRLPRHECAPTGSANANAEILFAATGKGRGDQFTFRRFGEAGHVRRKSRGNLDAA